MVKTDKINTKEFRGNLKIVVLLYSQFFHKNGFYRKSVLLTSDSFRLDGSHFIIQDSFDLHIVLFILDSRLSGACLITNRWLHSDSGIAPQVCLTSLFLSHSLSLCVLFSHRVSSRSSTRSMCLACFCFACTLSPSLL